MQLLAMLRHKSSVGVSTKAGCLRHANETDSAITDQYGVIACYRARIRSDPLYPSAPEFNANFTHRIPQVAEEADMYVLVATE